MPLPEGVAGDCAKRAARREAAACKTTSDAQHRRRGNDLRRRNRCDVTTYWRDPDINPWHELNADVTFTVAYLERIGHEELERGLLRRTPLATPPAIFEYARQDSWCFRTPALIERLEEWHDAGRRPSSGV